MRALLPRLALLAASLSLMLIVLEVALRIAVGPPVIWIYPQEHYLEDAELGYRLAPNQRAFVHDSVFETNSQGIRAAEIAPAPAPGTRRLLALGDSQTAGDGLELADTWPAQLSRHLESVDSRDWEVLNGGLSGASTWHYARLLRRLADVYQIDGVVVALYVNDVTPDPETPPVNVVTNTPAHRVVYVLKRSALFTALWRARTPILNAFRPSVDFDRETRILTGEHDPLLEQGWQAVETNLREIRDFTRSRGLSTWLLLLPRRDQVDGSQPGNAYNNRGREIADRLGLPIIDVLGPLLDGYQRDGRKLFIPWDGHNSKIANRVIAQELADTILKDR